VPAPPLPLPVLPAGVVGVAAGVVGVAAGVVAGELGTPAPPEPLAAVPAPVAGVVEVPPVLPPVLPPDDEEDEEPPLAAALVEVVDVFLVLDFVGVDGSAALSVGTVSVGAPAVFAEVEPPPPQPARPTASVTPAVRAAATPIRRGRLRIGTAPDLGPERVHSAPAVRTVV
jgi:hypothetical protein